MITRVHIGLPPNQNPHIEGNGSSLYMGDYFKFEGNYFRYLDEIDYLILRAMLLYSPSTIPCT